MADPNTMASHETNAISVKRYYHALVSAYKSISKPTDSAAPPAKAAALPVVPHEEDRQSLIKDIHARIDALESQLRDAKPLSRTESQKLRRLETKIDIFKSRLETLQG
jgi:hypothetical protein